MRLDRAIAARFPDVSRRQARQLLTEHRILVNDRPVSIASREIDDSDRISIAAEEQSIEILAMTDAFVAVNKPSGIPTQPARDRVQRSLEELLGLQLKQRRLPSTVYVVHRLDTGTSGVVVFARSRDAAATLSELFASHAIRKTYLARVEGVVDAPATIDSPVGGKPARTMIRPRGDGWIEAEPESGRMHQIRIHLASIGHPVVGDQRYGGSKAPRLMLHAWKLEHEMLGTIEAPLP
jgi:23S rRNA pseudouridine1911/1915/1917 synthase